MVSVLQDLRQNHNVVGVKAEFEAEGTRLEEAMRLKEVVSKAGLDLTIKIGGCEAIKDMYEARVIGVNKIVAPMVETAYALKKYLAATKLVFSPEERDEVSFLVNIETITGYNNLDSMLALPEAKELLDGIVLGRVDMSGSMNLSRDEVNSDKIFKIANEIALKAKEHNLDLIIGGGVSAESLPFFRKLPAGTISRYETRKVIFKCPEALDENADKAILKAVGFELMWLKNKRDFYGSIHKEDEQRLDMLEARYKKLIAQAGGSVE
ncbi:MAG: aldolase [Rickettsiales bacterium]|nr:aldolase [Rickettsiales bacterium]